MSGKTQWTDLTASMARLELARANAKEQCEASGEREQYQPPSIALAPSLPHAYVLHEKERYQYKFSYFTSPPGKLVAIVKHNF